MSDEKDAVAVEETYGVADAPKPPDVPGDPEGSDD